MKNTKNIVIGALLIVILAMAVGYSTFASELTLNGTAEITGEWDVKIIGIETKEVSEGSDEGTPQYTNTTATFNAKLEKPGDKITYVITIGNAGTIDALLDGIIFASDDENGSPAIIYSTSSIAEILKAGQQTTLEVTVTYDPNFTETPSVKTKKITGIIEYVQER